MTVSCYSQLHVSAQEVLHQALHKNMKSKIFFFTNICCKYVEFVIVILKRQHALVKFGVKSE